MERCLTLGCPEAARLALQDPCTGESIPGDENGYVLTCIRNWSIEPIVREGEASEFVADCGNMVVRDRQDDQLLGYTVSFETSTRSNELEALVSGGEVITSAGLSIGSYKLASNLACDTPSDDPRFIVELFYKLSRCVAGADHVRVVLPMAQFKVTEIDREGTITFYRYTAETGIALANAFGDGPYNDFPADVATFLAAQGPDDFTAGFDFEETITITGSCGAIEVPSDDGPGFFLSDDSGITSGGAHDVAVNPDGTYVTIASIDAGAGLTRIGLRKFLEDGNPDPSFGTGGLVAVTVGGSGQDVPFAIAIDPADSSIYVSAYVDQVGTPDAVVLKFDSAGVLDAGFGVAGIKTLGTGGTVRPVHKGLFVETTGEVVVVWNPNTNTGQVKRFDSAGVDLDSANTAFEIQGVDNYNGDGLYALGEQDTLGTGDYYVATADIDTATVVEVLLASFTAYGGYVTSSSASTMAVASNSAGDIFIGGNDPVTFDAIVIKVDNTLAADVTFGVAGFAVITDAGSIAADARNLYELAGGHIIVDGVAQTGGGAAFYTARLNASGALVGTYGTGGISMPVIPGAADQVVIQSMRVEEADGRAVHVGYYSDAPVSQEAIIIRTLLLDGSLDTSFG